MGIFDQMLTSLVGMDFFSVLFPFLLALAIFYSVLMWALKERLGKGPIGLISIILSFFVMLFAKVYIPSLSTLLMMGSGWTLAIASVILFLIIIFGLFGIKLNEIKDKWVEVIIALVVIYIIISLLWGGLPGFFVGLPFLSNNADVWTIVLFLAIIGIAWHFLSKDGGDDKDKPKPGKPG